MISERSTFELAIAPESNIVNFRYLPTSDVDVDHLNAQIRQQLLTSGKFYIVQTVIHNKRYLRTTIMRLNELEKYSAVPDPRRIEAPVFKTQLNFAGLSQSLLLPSPY